MNQGLNALTVMTNFRLANECISDEMEQPPVSVLSYLSVLDNNITDKAKLCKTIQFLIRTKVSYFTQANE